MLEIIETKQFAKDVSLLNRQGKDMLKLKNIIILLAQEKPLLVRHRDHALTGNFVGRRSCHIEPDWILMYQVQGKTLMLFRTGSHSNVY
jgi:addiction module toxin, RelE/StbE family